MASTLGEQPSAEPKEDVPAPTEVKEVVAPQAPPSGDQPKSFSLDLWSWVWFIALTVASFTTRLIWLEHPNEVVFDEVHFGGFTENYMKGNYFFDIHPPLGKLLLFLVGYLTDYNPTFGFRNINDRYPDEKYYWLRLGPAIAGAWIAPVAYLTAHHLSGRLAAILAAVLVITDLGFLCESKFILTDAYLFLFIATSYYTSLRAWATKPWTWRYFLWTFISGVSLGCTVAVKWTGLCVVGCVGLRHAWEIVSRVYRAAVGPPGRKLRTIGVLILQAVVSATIILAVGFSIYAYCWKLHFDYLPSASWGGRPAPTFWERFMEIHPSMFNANKAVSRDHHWDSYWSYWPFMVEGVAYWWGQGDKQLQHIYMMGNPFGWWLTTAITVLFVIYTCYLGSIRTTAAQNDYAFEARVLMLGHLINWLPYGLVQRSCFMYHYLPSIYFLYVLSAISIVFWSPPRLRGVIVALVCAAVIWAFWYWAPAVYALDLTTEERDARKWLWRWTL